MDVILTTYQGAILGPIARVLGYILEAIFQVLEFVGIQNIGVSIILFTFLVNALMLPLNIKQQKFSKMSSIMNPELMAIQEKYKNKKDQASQQKMSMETQAVYQKYGVSPASGCLPLLITFPILFALYRVIYNVPAYVDQVYELYENIAGSVQDLGITVEQLSEYVKTKTYVITDAVTAANNVKEVASVDLNYYVDVLGQFNGEAWDALKADYGALAEEIAKVSSKASDVNSFLTMNIADAPSVKSISILVPILSVITQILSTKLSMAGVQRNNSDNPTMQSMEMMNKIMPFVSGLMCFMFPIGVGIYWVAGSVFRILQTLGTNFYFSRIDMESEIQKNAEKSKRRLEKMGIDPNMQQLQNQKKSSMGGKKVEKPSVNASEVVKNVKKSEYRRTGNNNYKEGSIASYANMLSRDTTSKDEK